MDDNKVSVQIKKTALVFDKISNQLLAPMDCQAASLRYSWCFTMLLWGLCGRSILKQNLP